MPPKPKPGEGIVLVVDVSPGVRASTETTFLSQSQTCLINILQRKIFADKCRDMVGVVLFGTDGTHNNLASGEQYQHITVLQEPKHVDWDFIQKARNLPRGNSSGDWLDAIVVAMDLLQDPEGILYDTKKIVLMTDFNGEFSDDKVEAIIESLRDTQTELSVIGPDLDDDDEDDDLSPSNMNGASTSSIKMDTSRSSPPSLNWNGKPKSSQQLAAECLIKRVIAEVEGIICSFEEAIPQLILFEKKSQGSANWNAMLDIGPDFKIPVVGRIKVKRSVPPTWRRCCVDDETSAILSETSFHLKDENQTSVDSEDVISGFRYGTTLVPFSDADQQLKYACEAPGAVLSVVGFTSAANVPLTLRSGEQVVIVTAKPGDEDGAVALSAIVQAMKELDMVGISRRVYRKNLNPTLGALYPEITKDYECLVWVGLPFEGESRDFSFPSLSKVQDSLSQEQNDAMDQLITDMELNTECEEQDEELDPMNTVNPQLQHYFNCLTRRALAPSEPLPAPENHVLDILDVPEEQKQRRDELAPKLKLLFPTKKNLNYKQKKIDIFAKAASESSAATAANVSSSNSLSIRNITDVDVRKVSTATPADDFRALLRGERPHYDDICRQMSTVLLQLSESLTGDISSDRLLLEKVTRAIVVFREEAVAIGPTPFNGFIKELKTLSLARSFDQLWNYVVQENLGLISRSQTLKSSVTEEEALQFLRPEDGQQPEDRNGQDNQEEVDYDDMLDDL